MAFSGVTSRGSQTSNTSGTSVSVSPSARLEAYRIVFVACVTDNLATSSGASTDHTVTDSNGNTWNKVFEETDSDGAAADGSTTSLWWSRIIYPIETSNTITLTLSSAVTDKIIAVFEATVGAGKTVAASTNTPTHSSSGTSISNIVSGLTSREYLWVGLMGAEGEDTAKTPIANYTELFDLVSTTSGSADVNVQMHVGVRILTATGDTWTSSSVTFTNGVQTLTAFYEVDDSNRYGSLSASIGSISPNAAGVVEAQGSLSASIGNITITASGTAASTGSGEVSFRAGSTAGSSEGTNLSVSCPAGVQDGDILIAALYREGGSWTLPSGWSQIAEVQDRDSVLWLTVVWKRASSEGSSYTFQLSTTTWRTIVIAAFSGAVASGNPYNTYATRQADSSIDYTVKAASITTTVDGSMRVVAHANVSGDDIGVASSGMTQGPALGGVEIFYELDQTAGASGIETFTNTNYTARWCSIHIDIAPEVDNNGISGALSQSIGAISISAAGDVDIRGALSQAVGNVAVNGEAALEIAGTLSASIGLSVLSAAGKVDVCGALTQSIGTITLSAAGVVGPIGINGSLAQSIGTITVSATGKVDVRGALTQSIGASALSATGIVGPIGINGSLAQSIGTITISATGNVDVRGVLLTNTGAVTLGGVGGVDITGSLTQSIGASVLSAAGVVGPIGINGSLAQSVGAITISATGRVEVRGVLLTDTGVVTLSGVGEVDAAGSLAQSIAAVVLSSAGAVSISGSANISVDAILLLGSGVPYAIEMHGVTAQATQRHFTGRGQQQIWDARANVLSVDADSEMHQFTASAVTAMLETESKDGF